MQQVCKLVGTCCIQYLSIYKKTNAINHELNGDAFISALIGQFREKYSLLRVVS